MASNFCLRLIEKQLKLWSTFEFEYHVIIVSDKIHRNWPKYTIADWEEHQVIVLTDDVNLMHNYF